MQLFLRQSFPLERFHATPWRINPFDDPYGEWPPSPWRFVRAVVARWYQWRREISETWPGNELDGLIRALCVSRYSFHLPERARQSAILRQYHPVEFGWNPASKKVAGMRSYGTKAVPDRFESMGFPRDYGWGSVWTLILLFGGGQCQGRILVTCGNA